MAEVQPPLTLIVPLGGVGSRFQKEGYTAPKPFVNVLGKPMIHWLLDSLKLRPDDALVIVYDPGFIGTKYWEPVTSAYPNVSLVQLPGPTRGAAETVLLGLRGISRNLRSRPVMLVDGDTFYEEDIVSAYRDICATSNAVYYFEDTQPKPLYSYIVFDSSHRISQVKEKVKISDHANTGCYCFMRGVELEAQCQALLDANSTQLSQDSVGEYYTSGVIAQMIEEGHAFKALQVDPARMHVLGTPAQLQAFCVSRTKQPRLRICFDLDHTLVTAPRVPGDYSTCEPIAENVAACRALKAQGHHIIVATGRRMRTHKGNTAAVIADVGSVTLRQLAEFGIPHDEVAFGKPYAQFYIDDLAISAFHDLHKALGFYPGAPPCENAGPAGGGSRSSATPMPVGTRAPPASSSPGRWVSWAPIGAAVLVGAVGGLLVGTRMAESIRETFRGVAAAAATSQVLKATAV